MGESKQSYLKVFFCILQDARLSPIDKLVLAEIHYIDKIGSKPGCWMTNQQIASFLGVSSSHVSRSIQKLHELRLVDYKGMGKSRLLFSKLSLQQPNEIAEDESHQPNEIAEDEEENKLMNFNMQPNEIAEDAAQPNEIADATYLNSLAIDNKDYSKLDKKKKKDNVVEKTSTTVSSDETKLNKKTKRKKRLTKKLKHDSPAYELALYFWAAQLNKDPKVHPEMQNNPEKEEQALQKWASEFNKLLEKEQPPVDEVEKVILFVQNAKYWPRAKYSAGNIRQNYLAIRDVMRDKQHVSNHKPEEKLLDDPKPKLTAKFIKAHRKFVGKRWQPTNAEKNKFIQATKRALEIPNIETDWVWKDFITEMIYMLKEYYTDKGKPVLPGCWCSDFTWNTLRPQYLGPGVPDDRINSYEKHDDIDEMEAEEEKLSRQIERNLAKQNPQPRERKLDDNTCPEFDYINNI